MGEIRSGEKRASLPALGFFHILFDCTVVRYLGGRDVLVGGRLDDRGVKYVDRSIDAEVGRMSYLSGWHHIHQSRQ